MTRRDLVKLKSDPLRDIDKAYCLPSIPDQAVIPDTDIAMHI